MDFLILLLILYGTIITGILYYVYFKLKRPIDNYIHLLGDNGLNSYPILTPIGTRQLKKLIGIYNLLAEDRVNHVMDIKELRYKVKQSLDLIPLAVVEYNYDFDIIGWNPAAEEIFGYKREEIIGENITTILVPEDKVDGMDEERLRYNLNKIGKKHGINKNRKKNGEVIICEWYNTLI